MKAFTTIRNRRRTRLVLAAAIVVALAAAGSATASNRVATGASDVSLKITADSNTAILVFQEHGRTKVVSACCALNARPPDPNVPQFEFKLNYGAAATPGFCGPYDGPALKWVVAACKAPDGSYWAAQSWQRALPNQGRRPSAAQAEPELRISHWTGELEVLTVKQDWAYHGRFDHIYGSLTYLGKPMFGFKTDRYGVPLDKYGNLVYLDTFNSAYGHGWRRENSFVTHKPSGIFCPLISPHGGRPVGTGQDYRATAIGPGALPDVFWQARRRAYDPKADEVANAEQRQSFSDKSCKVN
jgi:hypothetical protein